MLSHYDLCAEYQHQLKLIASVNGPILMYGYAGIRSYFFARSLHQKSIACTLRFVQCDSAQFLPTEPEAFFNKLYLYIHDKTIGTLFIKNIHLLNLSFQEKLYSFMLLEKKQRIFVHAHQDLFLRVREGRFLKKLFYHLQSAPVAFL